MAKDSYEKTTGKEGYEKSKNSGSLVDEIPFDKYEKIAEKGNLKRGIKRGVVL